MLLNSWVCFNDVMWETVSYAPWGLAWGERKIREGKKEDAGALKCQSCFLPFKAVRSFTDLLFHSASHLHIRSWNLNLVIFNRCTTRSAVWAKAPMVSSIHDVEAKQPLQTPGKIYSPHNYQDRLSLHRVS